jgi:uncharacterized protein
MEKTEMFTIGAKSVLAPAMTILALGPGSGPCAAAEPGPSYACDAVEAGSIEGMICQDAGLSALDRLLTAVYGKACAKAGTEHPPVLRAEQRGWIKGRNDCWKSENKRACVENAYQTRIVELQARYQLVPHTGPVVYICNQEPANQVVVTYFKTDPPTLIAERGDSVSLMYLQPAASGAKYQGRNEIFWEHQGEALVSWGHDSPNMNCKLTP